MSRSLKHYKAYKQKLLDYASVINVTVEFKSEAGDGIYMPSKRKIRIDDDLDESTEIATFLHELGHAVDDLMSNGLHGSYVSTAYNCVYNGKPTAIQLGKVVKCEEIAWSKGRGIAKKLGIRLGKWYTEEEKAGLKDYKSTETK